MKDCSRQDHIFSKRILIEKLLKHYEKLHLCFVDQKKVSDSLPGRKIWETLDEYNAERSLVGTINYITTVHSKSIKCAVWRIYDHTGSTTGKSVFKSSNKNLQSKIKKNKYWIQLDAKHCSEWMSKRGLHSYHAIMLHSYNGHKWICIAKECEYTDRRTK